MRQFWIGLVIGLVVAPLLGLVIAGSGAIYMGADRDQGFFGWLGELMQNASLRARAENEENPLAGNRYAAGEGMHMYGAMCVQCHGAPDVEHARWAEGMEPEPPALWGGHMEEFSDGDIHHTIEHGVMLTGMPAFGEHLDENQTWQLVAFIRELDALDDAAKQELREDVGAREHGHAETGRRSESTKP